MQKKLYKNKAYIMGDYLEVLTNNQSYFATGKKKSNKHQTKDYFGSDIPNPLAKERSKFNSLSRTKRNLRHLVKSNFTDKILFLTLTFRENQQDYNEAGESFRKFMQHLKRKGFYYPYIATREKQKRGAIHYHIVLFDCLYIPYKDGLDYWAKKFNGNVDFVAVSHNVSAVVWYLFKYIKKSVDDIEFKKRYLVNKKVKRPKVLYFNSEMDFSFYDLEYSNRVISDMADISYAYYRLKDNSFKTLQFLQNLRYPDIIWK